MSIDVNGRQHVNPGVATGGQFTTGSRTESDVALVERVPADGPDYSAVAAANVAAVNARWKNEVGAPFDTARLQLRAIAAIVKDCVPAAASIQLECSDQEGSDDDLHVWTVLDADGNEIEDAGSTVREGRWEDEVYEMGFGLWPYLDGQPGVVTISKNGSVDVDLDGALAPDPEPAGGQPDPVSLAAQRGADTIAKYRALHDADVEDDTAVRDLLTDLHHWARTNGVDLDDVFARAGQYADEERDPLT